MNNGEIVVLQNTRFRGAEETKNGEAFAKELADLVDNEVFVMDAFGSAHRAHASTAGIPALWLIPTGIPRPSPSAWWG